MDRRIGGFLAAILMATAAGAAEPEPGAEPLSWEPRGFSLAKEVVVPGGPEAAFDAFTGDVSGWWDHHLSESPAELFIEPRPGGAFREVFDAEGNGAIHAEVVRADRGRLLQLRGPFGFSGYALDLVHTLTFEAAGDSTRVKLVIHGTGQVEDGWIEALSGVWDHFLSQYRKWVVSGSAN
jgi:hypothetical protein